MVEPQIRASIVLAADDPAALASFYGRLLKVEPQPGLSEIHWRVPWPPGGWLELYAPSRSRPQPRQSGRLALCLQRRVADGAPLTLLQAWTDEAVSLGARLLDPPRQEPFGAEVWLLDPEDNRLLLLVLSAGLPGSMKRRS
ncbi:MAG: VOC family protein [Synechococcaceae cyanobacterium]|nr:VOC family protein [Synechococcaceae cyanobacterium]